MSFEGDSMRWKEMALRATARVLGFNPVKSFISPSMAELGFSDGQANRIPEPGFGAYDKYLKAIADEGWVYSCVSRRAEDVANAPIHLFDANKKKVENHPVLDLLAKPNKAMDYELFIEFLVSSLLLTGAGYVLEDELRGLKPSSLWPLIPSCVKPIPNKDPRIFRDGYEYHVGGNIITFPDSQVLQTKLMNPSDYYYGLPPLAAARLSVDTHRAASRWNLGFFNNSARVDMVLETAQSLDDPSRKRMATAWNSRYQGEDKAHRIAFLERGTTAKIIGVNQKDMDFVLQKKMSREEICSVFKVPPAMVGLFEYANYANAKEQEQIYWRSTISPDCKRICGLLNRLLAVFDNTKGLKFALDESSVRALQEDEVNRSQYVDRYYRMGVPLNQLVDAYKLPFGHVPGGDEPFRPPAPAALPGPTPNEDPSAPDAPADEASQGDEPKPGDEGKAVLELKARKRKVFDGLEKRLTPGFRTNLRAHYDKVRDEVVSRMAHADGPSAIRDCIRREVKGDQALADVMAAPLRRCIIAARIAEDRMISTIGKGFGVLSGDLAAKGAVSLADKEQKTPERVERWVKGHTIKWAAEINDSLYQKLDGVIDEAIASGSSVSEISTLVADTMDEERDYRTTRIAQTEVIAALNEGALEAYRENMQVAGKAWLSTDDEATRESHRAAGQNYGEDNPIPVDEPFVVGDAQGLAPGQLGAPEEDINCRCCMIPIVKEATE